MSSRSTQCCLAVWSRWAESSTRLGGFRALRKTTEAPYTTKVNYREPTSRGTTPSSSTLVTTLRGIIFAQYKGAVKIGTTRAIATHHSRGTRSRPPHTHAHDEHTQIMQHTPAHTPRHTRCSPDPPTIHATLTHDASLWVAVCHPLTPTHAVPTICLPPLSRCALTNHPTPIRAARRPSSAQALPPATRLCLPQLQSYAPF